MSEKGAAQPAPPTRPYSASPEATRGYDDRGRQPDVAHDVLAPGTALELDGDSYRVESTLSELGTTGEAGVYLVRNSANSPLAFKWYRSFVHVGEEPNPEVLQRILQIDHEDVVRLRGFGRYRDRCYELTDFAAGGTLLDRPAYDAGLVTRVVVPQLFRGLRTLHERGIVHCDIKPQNIFYKDAQRQDLVIGDYGSAKLASERQAPSHTTTVKGTRIYAAPEQAFGLISDKNDYFSFGMVLVQLLYPDALSSGYGRIMERLNARRPIVDFSPKAGRLNDLLAGLTLMDWKCRWGHAEVTQWLSGTSVPVKYGGTHEVRPIRISASVEIQTPEQLVAYVQANSQWSSLLIDDDAGRRRLDDWLIDHWDVSRKRDFGQMLMHAGHRPGTRKSAATHERGTRWLEQSVLRFFEPDRPVAVGGRAHDLWRATNLQAEVAQLFTGLDDLARVAPLNECALVLCELEWSLRGLAASESPHRATARALVERIAAVLGAPPSDVAPHLGVFAAECTEATLLELAHTFIPERGFRTEQGQSINDLTELALTFARHASSFDKPRNRAELRVFLRRQTREALAERLGDEEDEPLPVDVLPPSRLSDFLFEVLSPHASVTLQLIGLELVFGVYTARFRVARALTPFLRDHGVSLDLARWSETLTIVVDSGRLRGDKAARLVDEICARAIETLGVTDEAIRLDSKDELYAELRGEVAAWRSLRLRPYVITASICLTLAGVWGLEQLRHWQLQSALDGYARDVERAAQAKNWAEAQRQLAQLGAALDPDLRAPDVKRLCRAAWGGELAQLLEKAEWQAALSLAEGSLGGSLCTNSLGEEPQDMLLAKVTSLEPSQLPPTVTVSAINALVRRRVLGAESAWLDGAIAAVGGPLKISGSGKQSRQWESPSSGKLLTYEIKATITGARWAPPKTLELDVKYELRGLERALLHCRPRLRVGKTWVAASTSCAKGAYLWRDALTVHTFSFPATLAELKAVSPLFSPFGDGADPFPLRVTDYRP